MHAILQDGRDTPPRSAMASLALIDKSLDEAGFGPIASSADAITQWIAV